MPNFQPFALEEWQSRWEQTVEINIADSGVAPLSTRELLELGDDSLASSTEALLEVALHYPEVNGTERLRRLMADLHPGVGIDQILVTVGAAEANAIIVDTLLGPGDQLVTITPNYAQVEGLATNSGVAVHHIELEPANGWQLDLDVAAETIERAGALPGTRMIALSNPNNPTGSVLSEHEIDRLVELAEAADAWILADEVYRGSELVPPTGEPPSFVGRSDRVIAINSLSKSYGLSGLRVGWIVGAPDLIEAAWRRHEYATITTSSLSMHLAELALTPAVRAQLFDRNRRVVASTAATLVDWANVNTDIVSITPPAATALAFLGLNDGASSVDFAHQLRTDGDVLVAPGACFGHDAHVRITHGLEPDRLDEALDRISRQLRRS